MTRLVIDVSPDDKSVTIDGSVKDAGELLGEAAFMDGKLQKTLCVASAFVLWEQGRISRDDYEEYLDNISTGRMDLVDLMELG